MGDADPNANWGLMAAKSSRAGEPQGAAKPTELEQACMLVWPRSGTRVDKPRQRTAFLESLE